jgi:RNA polymerase sigma-70 factor (ECF subfamily)
MPAAAAAATHAELARLIARGDRQRAAALLVRDHAPAVFALCRAMVRDHRLAEDLSQDAFARAFGALDGFRGEASPRTWLLKIARNHCLDHLARARRAPWAGADDPDPDEHAAEEPPPYDLLARREDAERAMAVLGESERALVVLHFGHGVGYPELADSFGLRAGAVRMRISRALARMRAVLAPQLDALSRADFDLEAPTPLHPASSSERAALRRASQPSARAWSDDVERTRAHLDEHADGELDLDAPESLDLEEGTLAPSALAPSAFAVPADPAYFADPGPPPTFDAIREEVSPALRWRLDALIADV